MDERIVLGAAAVRGQVIPAVLIVGDPPLVNNCTPSPAVVEDRLDADSEVLPLGSEVRACFVAGKVTAGVLALVSAR